MELVFVRGLVMQRAVPRDSIGRSDYGMVAASPMRVHPTKFQEKDLIRVVESVSKCCEGKLLQIVNFNVDRSQYVAAGHLACLEALGETLNAIRDEKDQRSEEMIVRDTSSKACKHFQRYKMSRGEMFKLKRGKATIPLPGIDVPFHSKYLLGGVRGVRECHFFSRFYYVTQLRHSKINTHSIITTGTHLSRQTLETTHERSIQLHTCFGVVGTIRTECDGETVLVESRFCSRRA